MSKPIRYSKKIAKFICDKLEEGMEITKICAKYPDMPHAKSIYRWRRKIPEFKVQYDTARQTQCYLWMDEHEELSKMPPPSILDVMDEYGFTDTTLGKIQLNTIMNQRRERISSLKFNIAKLAPKMVPELSDKLTIEHENAPNINILNYSLPEGTTNNLVLPPEVLEHKKDNSDLPEGEWQVNWDIEDEKEKK